MNFTQGALFTISSIIISSGFAQARGSSDTISSRKSVEAFRIESHISINGHLDEPEWQLAGFAESFTQYEPYNGASPSQPTRVKMLYDDDALYVGAWLFDSSPDSIYKELGQRDNSDNLKSDAFSVYISTYNDGVNYLQFTVSASGVQTDIKVTSDEEDRSWNAVWESEVSMDNRGWYVEMKIPYSALRFSKNDTTVWGVNFLRLLKRYNEKCTWNFVDKSKSGFTTQSGVLVGIAGIKPPPRLSFMPYLSAYANRYPDKSGTDYQVTGGMDLKLGLSQSFTLDATLIPDFGQVRSDDRILNLSPFEVKYSEARQFFTEGTELFNKGGIFYSRRVGSTPVDYDKAYESLDTNEVVSDNPSSTKLINASKLSGRTSGGLGIGVFNAVSRKTCAEITDTATGQHRKFLTQGLTNYNMLVFDQSLAHNSYASIVNTNVFRPDGNYTANVTATDFTIRDKKNKFAVAGVGAFSQIRNDSTSNGYKSSVTLMKTSGNFQGDVWVNVESKHFNPNDLGYLQSPNELSSGVELEYIIFKPFWRLNQLQTSLEYVNQMLYSPRNFVARSISGSIHFITRRYLFGQFYTEVVPQSRYDYYEPRTEGRKLKLPRSIYFNWYGSPDYRKTLALDHQLEYWKADGYNQYGFSYTIAPRIRFSDKLLLVNSWSQSFDYNAIGYFGGSGSNITMGKRDVVTLTNTLSIQFTFSSKSFINLRARHYIRHYKYDSFYTLNLDGTLTPIASPEYSNKNYNLFNVDFYYQWIFAPGSELVFAWKNMEEEMGTIPINSYFDNVDRVFGSPQYNSFSIKFLYYIDYQMIARLAR